MSTPATYQTRTRMVRLDTHSYAACLSLWQPHQYWRARGAHLQIPRHLRSLHEGADAGVGDEDEDVRGPLGKGLDRARREQLLVALGPAVSGPNYQVERSTSEQLGPIDDLQAAGALLDDPQEGRDRLDIRRAAHWQLLQFGLRTEQISICPLCTVAEPELFHSWRRDQVKAVQWSGIVSQNADTPR